jgi:hypothetical protein
MQFIETSSITIHADEVCGRCFVDIFSCRRFEPELAAAIAVAGAGVIGWILADEPIVATACVVAADLIGTAMMMPKTYRDPESETLVTFALASLAGALAAGAVGVLDVSLLLYPIYYCGANAAVALVIHQRRRVAHATPPLTAQAG